MYTTYQKYPGFNSIEIVAELEAPLRKQSVLKPVTTGNKIQRLDFKPENFNIKIFNTLHTHRFSLLQFHTKEPQN